MSPTRFNEFNDEVETWDRYLKRFTFHLTAHEVTEADRKKAVFITVIGPKCFGILCDLAQPEDPENKTYEQLITILTTHFCPKPSKLVSRVSFLAIYRERDMKMADFVATLRKASQHCEFGVMLEDFLLLQFVSGIKDREIQTRLLDMGDDLTFSKAFALATAMETSRKDCAIMRKDYGNSEKEEEDTHKVNISQPPPSLDRRKSESLNIGTPQHKERKACFRCGMEHKEDCFHANSSCFNCGKRGHISRVCRQRRFQGFTKDRKYTSDRKVYQVDNDVGDIHEVLTVHGTEDDKYVISVKINNVDVLMEIDSGATKTIIGKDTWETIGSERELKSSNSRLRSFGGHIIKPLGQASVKVSVYKENKIANVIVAPEKTPNLFGRDWMTLFGLEIVKIHNTVIESRELKSVLQKHASVFQSGVGMIKGVKAHIALKDNAEPKFCKARPVPYALRPKVEIELKRLVDQGILEPVTTSAWAAPIVVVPKSDGSVRICGDFSQTVNPMARIDQYPMPNIEDILYKIREAGGGHKTSLLDVSHAFEHLGLDDVSQNYVVINTHMGLFRYTRVPYGLAAGPALFQKAIEEILSKIGLAQAFIDDVMVSGRNDSHHIQVIDEVLTAMSDANVRLNKTKCQFMKSEVKYLGFMVNQEGIKPARDLLDAIQTTPPPKTLKELKAYLGLLTFYSRFIPQMATGLEPLYQLLRGNQPWLWGSKQQEAFTMSKRWLTSEKLLVHFDPKKHLLVTCDASPYGVGVVLSHPGGSEQAERITSGSRTLSTCERNYSQLDREALALIFAVDKFHKYLYGRRFTLETDHKPLLGLFGKNKKIPDRASPRLTRWAIKLAAYDFDLVYKKGTDNNVADALSRMPSEEKAPSETDCISVSLLELESSLLNHSELVEATKSDTILKELMKTLRYGTDLPVGTEFSAYKQREHELNLESDLIIWGQRVIIPKALRFRVMCLLHEGHPGIVKMKEIARSHFWWPGLDKEIEDKVKACSKCQSIRHLPPKEAPVPWPEALGPWSRLHLDHAGPFHGQLFLIVVDAHSKWVEVKRVASTSCEQTVAAVREMFSCHGLPHLVVSDNGSAFTGSVFRRFLALNGIEHIYAPPYHPQSNGAAERVVQTVKQGLSTLQGKDWSAKLSRMLFHYRTRPHATTGVSPAELLMGRQLRTHFDYFKGSSAYHKQDTSSRESIKRYFKCGDSVWIRGYNTQPKWMSATIRSRLGKVIYETVTTEGIIARRHINHVRPRNDRLTNIHPHSAYVPFTSKNTSAFPAVSSPRVGNSVSRELEVTTQETTPKETTSKETTPKKTTPQEIEPKETTPLTSNPKAMVALLNKPEDKGEVDFGETTTLRRSTRIRSCPKRLIM